MKVLGISDPLRVIPTDVHRLSVGQYHRMVGAGVFGELRRIELLDGVVVQKPVSSPPHARVIVRLTRLLLSKLGGKYEVRVQLPITLGNRSEPEPDFSVVRAPVPRRSHPRFAVLVIEVSRSSLRKDRVTKGRIYAQAAIPDYWIIDIPHRRVEVYRRPDRRLGCYRRMTTLGPTDTLKPLRLRGLSVSVGWLFR